MYKFLYVVAYEVDDCVAFEHACVYAKDEEEAYYLGSSLGLGIDGCCLNDYVVNLGIPGGKV